MIDIVCVMRYDRMSSANCDNIKECKIQDSSTLMRSYASVERNRNGKKKNCDVVPRV